MREEKFCLWMDEMRIIFDFAMVEYIAGLGVL
jgi:hypothetical protein